MWPWNRKPAEPLPSVVPKGNGLRSALYKAKRPLAPVYPIKAPTHAPGVVPKGERSGIAMDENFHSFLSTGSFGFGDHPGFPGYQRLSMFATIAEYRAMAESLSTELTREWIKINSSETDDDATKEKVAALTKAMDDIGLQQVIQRAAEHDAYFGRAQIFIDIKGQDRATPLILSDKTIPRIGDKSVKDFIRVTPVEAVWTTPSGYNALDPAAPDFYKPSRWFMLGKQVHASRLLTVITRPLPDLLKPAFDFGGMSLSQLAESTVNNWLRTRESVGRLLSNFSITALKTKMGDILQGGTDDDPGANGDDLIARADLFAANRDNQGFFLLDFDTEDLVQQNVPLGGLHELQAQSQEHMCAIAHQPAIILAVDCQ
jgi:uncharacterized protein